MNTFDQLCLCSCFGNYIYYYFISNYKNLEILNHNKTIDEKNNLKLNKKLNFNNCNYCLKNINDYDNIYCALDYVFCTNDCRQNFLKKNINL